MIIFKHEQQQMLKLIKLPCNQIKSLNNKKVEFNVTLEIKLGFLTDYEMECQNENHE